ncbi:dTDP-4-dehydrorhamnose reductase [Sinorhizobium medicae]|uniref:dTDP-4-dehydrorhamnose reductase n=1 Tax=Sinorhizobium medicae TaxID=110321 RepID=UPI000C79D09B|nr:dTDP-4-dehydrorhamnose reductase [Sinorhizobium medicae]MDX0456673.1 dTDP-4-dehydrorhamnose reductase [Sinorhizobium medicae]MDX0517765.1 dTDP-4-dehydrorhamnose reductase [Sinorhizobium medicae]MDX0728322.1 dTDP-4-dehydrorhamnose reductase [Sinorhizobium medicae]MDX0734484.1 dTDP-4-dehydrorhamnose reductase [Sinorhizobium medicae]MDX0814339.1 dTDP-4-dehydrorhamnose reductase [Sinorhizobium medicae]
MKVLATGTTGQVVTCLTEIAVRLGDVELITIGRPEFDLINPVPLREAIVAASPDVVVSAAAYTAVDRAEDEPARARAVNVAGAACVAEAAARLGVPLIHLSTDYVFSGDDPGPRKENDQTRPRTLYGASKLDGEKAVASITPRHVILRTSWVYSPFGTNFVRTILRLAKSREILSVVDDQHGNPTSALDLAAAILEIARSRKGDAFGVYHLAGTGGTNWSDFARHILAVSHLNGGPFATIRGIASADYPTRARRPQDSRLCTDKFEGIFGWCLPPWQDSTKLVVRRLLDPDLRLQSVARRPAAGGE